MYEGGLECCLLRLRIKTHPKRPEGGRGKPRLRHGFEHSCSETAVGRSLRLEAHLFSLRPDSCTVYLA